MNFSLSFVNGAIRKLLSLYINNQLCYSRHNVFFFLTASIAKSWFNVHFFKVKVFLLSRVETLCLCFHVKLVHLHLISGLVVKKCTCITCKQTGSFQFWYVMCSSLSGNVKKKPKLLGHPLLHKLCNFFNLTPCLFTKHLMFCCHGDKDPDKTSHAYWFATTGRLLIAAWYSCWKG